MGTLQKVCRRAQVERGIHMKPGNVIHPGISVRKAEKAVEALHKPVAWDFFNKTLNLPFSEHGPTPVAAWVANPLGVLQSLTGLLCCSGNLKYLGVMSCSGNKATLCL